MKKKEDGISRLLQRYLSGHQEGRDAYFDADEIDSLLDSFEESDDYTYYDEVLALGLRLHPGNTDLQVRQCKSFVYNEDYESALALIETIAETDNQDLDMLRLECYVMQDSYDKVVEYTEKLIADKCEYLETIFEYIAPILGDAEMNKEAHDYINRGLMLFPDNMILKDELCYNLEIEGDIEKAIGICNELIDKNPYSNDYWFTLGRLYSISGDYEKAIEAFDFALTCDDSDEELKILKAYCLYMNENYEKAIEVYNEIATTDEIRARITPLLAECYVKLEDYEKAYELLKEQLSRNGLQEDSSTYINYIRCCVETGREKEASDNLMKASKLFPKNVRILSLLALTYLENGEEKKVEDIFESYLKKTISIRDTFVRKEMKENFYHGILLGILGIKEEWGVFSNQETGEGYSDILIETENSETAILIEVKYAGDGNLDVACERALKQVEERKYDEELRENGVDKILKYGIACYMKRCKVKLAEESYIET